MEFTREPRRNVEVETNFTLLALKNFLATNPNIPEDILERMRRAVTNAESEIREHGHLGAGTAEYLDDLYRPYK